MIHRRRIAGVSGRGRSQWLVVLALCSASPHAATAQINGRLPAAPWEGSELVSVRVEGALDASVGEEIETAVRERVDVLDADSIRTALAIAHSRLPGGDIEARVDTGAAGGAQLVVLVHAEEVVDSVQVSGVPEDVKGWQSQVLVATGDRLIENRLLRTVYGLEEVIEDAGYLDARVALSVQPAGDKRMAIQFEVVPGNLVRVESVTMRPPLPTEVAERTPRLVNSAGEPYLRDRLREDTNRVRRHLVDSGYRQARVRQPEAERDEDRVVLRYPVSAGPKMHIDFVGFDVKPLRKSGRLPVLRQQGFDPALIPATSRVLADFMQSKGYFEAEVEVETVQGDDASTVTFLLTPGEKKQLESVSVLGGVSFDLKRLQALILTKAGRPLVDSELNADVGNLRSFYIRQGFAEVEVHSSIEMVEEDRLAVSITIDEGPHSTVRSVEVRGIQDVDREEILDGLPIGAGHPFHDTVVRAGAAEIQSRYRRSGYRSALVTSEVAPTDDPLQHAVVYQVLEGRQVEVGEVFVRGLERTDPGFMRKVLGLKPGDILSDDGLVEAEARLFQLGLFAEVDVRSSPAAPFAASEDLVVEVVEAPIHRVSYGLGWDSDDGLRGVLGYVRNNWLGRGMAWNLDTSISAKEKLYRLLLTQPWIGGHRTPVSYSLFLLDEDRESFELEQAGVQVGARQQRGQTTSGLLFTWRRNEASAGAFSLDREIAPVEIVSMTPSLFVDRRDDAFDPSRGWSGLAEIEQAFSVFSTEESFTKLFAQYTRYLDIGRAGTLAGAARAGWIHPISTAGVGFDRALIPSEFESSQVHISERFVSGGRSSHRAYDRFELGERGETLLLCDDLPLGDRDCAPGEVLPIGGTALGLLNLDWRFPLYGGLGGVAFVDAGNVWADWRHADRLKLGAGVGVRYSSPLGPLRLEVAWKLDREPFEDPYVIVISVGNPF